VGVKDRAQLLKEHTAMIRIARACSMVGLLSGLVGLKLGWFSRNDWRALSISLDLTACLPIVYVVIANSKGGFEGVKEVFVTMSMAEKLPVRLYCGVISAFLLAGIVSVVSLLLRR
jgi:hypothetical protein